jgi:uncharacterized protein (DUF433 family)
VNDNGNMAGVIVRDPDIMCGVPVFRRTRVTAETLFDYLEGGDTLDEFLDGFPAVSRTLALDAHECIDQRLRLLFPDHDRQTAGFARLGLKNSRLLDASEAAGF